MSGYFNSACKMCHLILTPKKRHTKRPDVNVTSSKPREKHMTCAPFANLVEWGIWKGKDGVLKLFSTSTVFAFPGRPDCSSISFSSSTESELHKDPASLINLLLLFKGKPLVVGFTWGPLWSIMACESVERCKSFSNAQKICQWFWKLTPARTCKPFWKFLR